MRALLAGLLALLFAPLSAPSSAIVATGPPSATIAALHVLDRRVAEIGYRLAAGAGSLCPTPVPTTGLLLHGRAQYAERDRATLFGEHEDFAVLGVAGGSPAAAAGILPGDALLAVNGLPLDGGAADAMSFAPVAAVETRIADALGAGPVRLTLGRAGTAREVEVAGTPACATRFQLVPGRRLNAGADGRLVTISSAMAEFTRGDDELALVLAHELAHNVLGHRAQLDALGTPTGMAAAFGKNPGRIRATEDEADRMALHLMARAGYDIRVAPAFWERYVRRTGGGIFSDRTHSGRRARVEAAEREIARIEAQIASGEAPTPF